MFFPFTVTQTMRLVFFWRRGSLLDGWFSGFGLTDHLRQILTTILEFRRRMRCNTKYRYKITYFVTRKEAAGWKNSKRQPLFILLEYLGDKPRRTHDRSHK